MITMRRTLPICVLIASLGYASFSRSGASQHRTQSSATPTATNGDLPIVEDDKFNIQVTSETDKFTGGQPIQVDISLKNNGASKTSVPLYPVELFFDVEVIGPYQSATPLLPSRLGKRFGGSIEGFALGHTRTLSGSVVLSNLYSMSLQGTYKVRVSKRFRFQDAKRPPVVIRSNTLVIKVASDAPISEWHSPEEKR